MRALVFRSAYSASRNARASAAFAASIKAHCAVFSETLMLQVRFAHPPMPHRTGSSSCSGVPVGLLSYLRAIPPFGALAFRSAYWLSPHHPALRRAGVPFGLLAAPNARTPVASRPTASSNARPPGSLRSSSVSAPNQLFELLRCSGRLIELKLKRSTFRFASLTLRCRTESAFQAVPVFRMAYLPYLTVFRMQAKQIQRLPLRGAGAKRLKGGPLGIGARGRGPQAPSPICTWFAAALDRCTE